MRCLQDTTHKQRENVVEDGVTVKSPVYYLIGGKVTALTETVTVQNGKISRVWNDEFGHSYQADPAAPFKPSLPDGSMYFGSRLDESEVAQSLKRGGGVQGVRILNATGERVVLEL